MTTTRLNVRDGIATLLVVSAGASLAWHLAAPEAPYVGSARWVALPVFVLGLCACATGARNIPEPGEPRSGYQKLMSAGGVVALVLLVATIVFDVEALLLALAAVVGAKWLVATMRHATSEAPRESAISALSGESAERHVALSSPQGHRR